MRGAPDKKAADRDLIVAVRAHPGNPREYYVGMLSNRHSMATVRERIRTALRRKRLIEDRHVESGLRVNTTDWEHIREE